MPPWLIDPPRTDDTLASGISKHEEPEALLALSKCLIEDYGDYTHVYTDASKTADGKVGIGCYIEASCENAEVKDAKRVTDNVSVYAGEIAAIWLALHAVGKNGKR